MNFDLLELPAHIQETCERIWKECQINKRKSYRLELKAWIIYHAYLEHDIHKNFASVCKMVGIAPNRAQYIIRKYGKESRGYDPPTIVANPQSIIESVCKSLKLIDSKRPKEILEEVIHIMKDKKYNPTDLCLVCVMRYLEENDIEWKYEFCETLNRKPIEVKRIYNILKYHLNDITT